jgi:hypothetical protein
MIVFFKSFEKHRFSTQVYSFLHTFSFQIYLMKKSAIIVSIFILAVIASFSFKKPETMRYENLKVLSKNTTKQQMDSVMKHFSASLGVRCTYCHVRGNDAQANFDFASDANKKKLVARDMMRMTSKINKKYFGGGKDEVGQAITCYSCHHGQEEPATKPPAPAPREQQPAPSSN